MQSKVGEILQQLQYEDLTEQLDKLVSNFQKGEMIHIPSFTLLDSMAATELGDPKMDIKQGLQNCDQPKNMLQKGLIQYGQQLTPQQLNGIFDEVMAKEVVWLQGHSLLHSVYQFVYLYDQSLYSECNILKALINNIFFRGNITYEMLRYSGYLREDDYVISLFSFPALNMTKEDIEKQISDAQESLADKITSQKKKKNKKFVLNEYDGLDARLRFQKTLLMIFHHLQIDKSNKQSNDKLSELIASARNRLAEIENSVQHSQDVSGFFSKTMLKTITCSTSPRPFIEISKEEGIQGMYNLLNNLEFVIKLQSQRDYFTIAGMLEKFQELPKNVFIKAYLDQIIFNVPRMYFGQIEIIQMLKNDLQSMGIVDISLFQKEEFQVFFEQLLIVCQEYLSKLLKNTYRQYREFAKFYQDLSIIIIESRKVDQHFFVKNKKDQQISQSQQEQLQQQLMVVWAYKFSLKIMIKQIHLQIKLDLLDEADFPCCLFYLDYVHNILEKNSMGYLTKFDKEFLLAYNNKVNLDKKKKKLTDYQKVFFYEYQFQRACQLYSKGLSRLLYMLLKQGAIKNFNTEEQYKFRFNNRYKIFSNVYYIQQLDYDTYTKIMDDFYQENQTQQCIDKIKDWLNEAIQTFQGIPSQDELIPSKIREDAKSVEKVVNICIEACNVFEKNKDQIKTLKIEFNFKENPYYPGLILKNV